MVIARSGCQSWSSICENWSWLLVVVVEVGYGRWSLELVVVVAKADHRIWPLELGIRGVVKVGRQWWSLEKVVTDDGCRRAVVANSTHGGREVEN